MIFDAFYKPEFKFIYMFLATDFFVLEQKYHDHLPVMLLMSLDYIDESLASLPVSEQSTLKGQYLGTIADWANQYEAYLQQLSDDRIIAFTTREKLSEMINHQFKILEDVRKISEKHNGRVTLSMGVASWDSPYESLGVYAQNAIELAEKRGGDQAVVNIQNQKIAYFGATRDAVSSNSRVNARIQAQTMKQLFEASDAVYIMGHKRADLDALGAMLGTYQMAKVVQNKTFIIAPDEELDPTAVKVFREILTSHNDPRITLDQIIITNKSVLVIVDTQSKQLLIDPSMVDQVGHIIIIDHHRASEDVVTSENSYIEPYASSTVELVMDVWAFYENLIPIEFDPLYASVMYGGMVVDTNQFTIRTGPRTFEVAAKLKELGADLSKVHTWLKKDFKKTKHIYNLISLAEVIESHFMILKDTTHFVDRVLLAQAAEAALDIENIDAVFSVGYVKEGIVGVSARSNGQVNVQVLMEFFGGGGHLTSAAVQKEANIDDMIEAIKQKINLEYGGQDQPMKVILLEDVKGRGKKDEVIEVAGGYGQFLLTQKKAMLANDDNLKILHDRQEKVFEDQQKHTELMKTLKQEIDHKHIKLTIQVGKDGKLFGAITTKHIVETFEKTHGITLDKKKVELSSDINSVGIYTVIVHLHKGVDAQFEVHIDEEKKD
jgi:ribosomal protein L9